MKKYYLISFITLLIFLTFNACCGSGIGVKDTNQKLSSELPQQRKLIACQSKQGRYQKIKKGEYKALSLKILQKKLKDCESKRTCQPRLLKLEGLNKIFGYVIDETNQDLILIGKQDTSLPPLYLEDFVIALRSVYKNSDPACTIDPEPRVIEELQSIGNEILTKNSPDSIEKILKKWDRVCRKPQNVRVSGIPFDTHFAHVMVKADYDMKRLVDGSDSLSISGFISLTDMFVNEAKASILKGKHIPPFSSMNRFWFSPGEVSYIEDAGIVFIKQCPVRLLTEEEHLKQWGTGKRNPMAAKFAKNFTKIYDCVAKERPIYEELENLFRFVALAKAIKFRNPFFQAEKNLSYLLNNFHVTEKQVSRSLEGRSNVKRFEHRRDVYGGYETAMLWLPSCGGVEIGIRVNQRNFRNDTELSIIRDEVLRSRPSRDALAWTSSPISEDNILVFNSSEMKRFLAAKKNQNLSETQVIITRDQTLEWKDIISYKRLEKNHKGFKFYLDDKIKQAKENIKKLESEELLVVNSGKDIAVYSGREMFKVYDYKLADRIKDELKEVNIPLVKNARQIEHANILIIPGHKDNAFNKYLYELAKNKVLKDKVVVLLSCGQGKMGDLFLQEELSFNSRIIETGDAIGILFYSEKIKAPAVEEVLVRMTEELKKGKIWNIEDLLYQCADKLKGEETDLDWKNEYEILKRTIKQASSALEKYIDESEKRKLAHLKKYSEKILGDIKRVSSKLEKLSFPMDTPYCRKILRDIKQLSLKLKRSPSPCTDGDLHCRKMLRDVKQISLKLEESADELETLLNLKKEYEKMLKGIFIQVSSIADLHYLS